MMLFSIEGARLRLADLAACLRFFSRIAIARINRDDDPAALPRLPRAAAMVPFAGALIALPAGLAALVLSHAHLPPLATGIVIVALTVLPTGALHEDGLADCADGLFGGRDRDRRLAIMKDSRIGAFGAVALVLVLAFKAACYGALATDGGFGAALLVPPVAGAVSRLAMVWLWQALPAARPDGLSATLGRPDLAAAVGASLATFVLTLLLMPRFGIDRVIWAAILTAVATYVAGRIAERKIGGQTGDVLGAAECIAEAAFIAGLCL